MAAALSDQTKVFLECANQLLSSSSTQEGRRYADEWLQRFQLSVEAWMVVDQVLSLIDEPTVLFLAAQTLNRKIRYDREQLGNHVQTWESLRQAIVTSLMKHAKLAAVRTQLALAFVALLVQMETWAGAVDDLLRLFDSNPPVLMEVLRRLPEDLFDESLDVNHARRYQIQREMNQAGPVVLATLVRNIQRDDNYLLLDCFRAWIQGTDLSSQDIARSNLIVLAQNTISKLVYSKEFEAACELLIETVYRFQNPVSPQDDPLVDQLLNCIMAMDKALDEASSRGNVEVINGISRVYSYIAELYVPLFIDGVPQPILFTVLSMSLKILLEQDYQIAKRSHHFVVDFLMRLGDMEEDIHRRNAIQQQIQPWIDAIFTKCVERMVRPEDEPESEDEEDVDGNSDGGGGDAEDEREGDGMMSEFQNFREHIGDIINALLRLSEKTALPPINDCYGTFATRLQVILQQADVQGEARVVEGCLKSIHSVIQIIAHPQINDSRIDSLVQQCFYIGGKWSQNDARVRRTMCDVIQACCDYTCVRHPQYGQLMMGFLIESLTAQQRMATKHAARTLRYIFLGNHIEFLLPDLERLFELCKPFDENMNEDARLNLLEGLTSLWSAAMAQARRRPDYLNERTRLARLFSTMISIPLTALGSAVMECQNRQQLQQQGVAIPPRVSEIAESSLYCLTTFVRFSTSWGGGGHNEMMRGENGSDQPPEAVTQILQQIWPHLQALGMLPDKAMESLIRFMKHSIRIFPEYCRSVVPALLNFTVQRYALSPACSFLYLTGVIFQQYFDSEELVPNFAPVLDNLVGTTLTRVLISPDAFVRNPEFVDDLFYLAKRSIEYVPDALLANTQAFDRLLEMAARIGLTLYHREAFRSVAMFLEEALRLGGNPQDHHHESSSSAANRQRYRARIIAGMDQFGQQIANTLIAGMAGGLPLDRIDEPGSKDGTATDVLVELFFFWDENRFGKVVSDALALQTHLTNELRGSFLKSFIEDADRSRNAVMQSCSEFHAAAMRRLRRTSPDMDKGK